MKERLGEPSEFSDAVVSIVGSSYLTGCVIRLDGGLRVPHIWKIDYCANKIILIKY